MRILTRSLHYQKHISNQLARWLGGCVHCGSGDLRSDFSARMCVKCANQIEGRMLNQFRCKTCATALETSDEACLTCLMNPPLATQCTTFADYSQIMQHIILAYKFHHKLSYAPLLADILWAILRTDYSKYDLMIAVPQHEETTRARGFIPLAFILEQLGNDKIHKNAVVRLKHPLQVGAKASLRRQQIKGAFAAIIDLTGLNVLLVDDVYTTGATLNELARVCLEAGANQVNFLVLTRSRLIK